MFTLKVLFSNTSSTKLDLAPVVLLYIPVYMTLSGIQGAAMGGSMMNLMIENLRTPSNKPCINLSP